MLPQTQLYAYGQTITFVFNYALNYNLRHDNLSIASKNTRSYEVGT